MGLALGAYGLTQAILQIPFGWASDRWGRKPVIVVGLVLFAAGSFLAAWAPTIGWTIAGRTLQGAGAISAAVIALTADLTRDEVRTRAMALIGMTIGATFALSLVAGPALNVLIGVPGIFVLTGVLALAAIGLLYRAVPAPEKLPAPHESASRQWRRVLTDGQLLRLNYGIFALHAALMALFVQVPFMLRDNGVPVARHWIVYLPVLLVSVALMAPAMMRIDRPGRGKPLFIGAIAVLFVGQALLAAAGASLALHGRRDGRLLHRVQPARGDAAVAHLQVRAAGDQGHRVGRLFERPVPRHVRRRGGRRLAGAAPRQRCRVRLLPAAHRVVARGERDDERTAHLQQLHLFDGRNLMASVNKVILVGNLGKDPETRYATSGAAICNITLATSRQWKDKASGEKREETEWHRVVFYDRLAEIAGEYLKKGRPVYVEGRLKTRKWQDKEGQDRYTTEIIAEEMQLLGSREGGGGGGGWRRCRLRWRQRGRRRGAALGRRRQGRRGRRRRGEEAGHARRLRRRHPVLTESVAAGGDRPRIRRRSPARAPRRHDR